MQVRSTNFSNLSIAKASKITKDESFDEKIAGIRKVRFPLENRGKSGSVRVCYTDFAEYEVIYLITAFEKKDQENLSVEEKNVLKKLVKSLKKEAAKNRR